MAKQNGPGKARAVWFGVVDVMILLIIAGFICSMFLIDGKHKDENVTSPEKLIFAVSVQSPYQKELFVQESGGTAVPLTLRDSETVFGNLILGDDGVFYVECELSVVEHSEDREGLWMLGDTVLMSGEVLLVESQLADFSITILSTPVQGISGSAGTTAETSEKQTSEPLDTVAEIEHDTSEPQETLSEAEVSAVESEAVSEPSADGE